MFRVCRRVVSEKTGIDYKRFVCYPSLAVTNLLVDIALHNKLNTLRFLPRVNLIMITVIMSIFVDTRYRLVKNVYSKGTEEC